MVKCFKIKMSRLQSFITNICCPIPPCKIPHLMPHFSCFGDGNVMASVGFYYYFFFVTLFIPSVSHFNRFHNDNTMYNVINSS